MTQTTSDLLAALTKKKATFIKADDVTSATDVIEDIMGKCWKVARGSRHVARKMLEDDFVPLLKPFSVSMQKFVEDFDIGDKLEDGEVPQLVMWGYRPLTDDERHDRLSRKELERLRRKAEKAKPRFHRWGRVTWAPEPSFSGKKTKKKKRFSQYLSKKKIRKYGIGNLSLG
jgi:hypothetical protein